MSVRCRCLVLPGPALLDRWTSCEGEFVMESALQGRFHDEGERAWACAAADDDELKLAEATRWLDNSAFTGVKP